MIELRKARSYNSKCFDKGNGFFNFQAHVGHVHYFNKLEVGDGDKGFREIDWTLLWDENKRGWGFEYHSFHPFLPEYADDWIEFRDVYEEKDQVVKYKAQCEHVRGRLVMPDKFVAEGLVGFDPLNLIIYDNAFGEGIDLILYFTRSALKKVVRIKNNYKPNKDISFEFEISFPVNVEVKRGNTSSEIDYVLDITKNKEFDTQKQTLIGMEKNDGKEWNTFLRPFYVWDMEENVGLVKVEYVVRDNKKFLRKTISKQFLEISTGDVFTDTTTSYYVGSGDGYCSYGYGGITPSQSSWNASHDGWGSWSPETQTTIYAPASAYTNETKLRRAFLPIDTSALPDAATISTAVLKVYVSVTCNSDNDGDDYIAVVETFQVSTSSLTNDDYRDCGSDNGSEGRAYYTPIEEGSDQIDITGIGTSGYTSLTLNATGRGWISKTGYTKIGIREGHDLLDHPIQPFSNSLANYAYFRSSEYTGTSQDPYIEITYSTGATTETIQKSLKYTVEKEMTAITKSLKYAVVKGITAITKSLTYKVSATLTAITKSLKYTVVGATAIQKSLKYTVEITPTAITKSLKYAVEVTPSAITKALRYEVETTAPVLIQKSLQYAVEVTPSAITKSLHYVAKPSVTIQKSLKYTVESTPFAITKSLKYTVTVEITAIQKSLKYVVETTPTAITKALEYRVDISPSAITKGLIYQVLIEDTIQKSLKYTVETIPSAITKSLQYILKWEDVIQKSLKYVIETTPSAITKSLEYAIEITPVTIQKSLEYLVLSLSTIQKSLKYAIIIIPTAITKSLEYILSWEEVIQKSLKYVVETTPATIQKSLQYLVTPSINIQKSLKYVVVSTPSAVTKLLTYYVTGQSTIIQKFLKYVVQITPASITKSLTYSVELVVVIQKSLEYAVEITPSAITKGLEYQILTTPSVIQKSLQYILKFSTNIQKSLKYTVFYTPTVIQKSLTYQITITPATITKSLQYIVEFSTAIQKSLKYTIESTPSAITKSLTYQLITTRIVKSLKYTVFIESLTIQKSLRYVIAYYLYVYQGTSYNDKYEKKNTVFTDLYGG